MSVQPRLARGQIPRISATRPPPLKLGERVGWKGLAGRIVARTIEASPRYDVRLDGGEMLFAMPRESLHDILEEPHGSGRSPRTDRS